MIPNRKSRRSDVHCDTSPYEVSEYSLVLWGGPKQQKGIWKGNNTNVLFNWAHFRPLFSLISSFQYSLLVQMIENKIANDWTQTADPWCRKWPLYQLRYNRCPTCVLYNLMNRAHVRAECLPPSGMTRVPPLWFQKGCCIPNSFSMHVWPLVMHWRPL